jgi:hypothetical protein
VPFDGPEPVFRALAVFGERLKRVPDGETGTLRRVWIQSQFPVFRENSSFDRIPDPEQQAYSVPPVVQLRPGVRREEITFGPLGYARWAMQAWTLFERLKREAAIPSHWRFQVAVPTSFQVVHRAVAKEHRQIVGPVYHARLMEEMREIVQAIPNRELALQVDICLEIGVWEGLWSSWHSNPKEALIDEIVDLADALPKAVELGYHLCYGDFRHQHFTQPRDTAILTEIANRLIEKTRRPINWLHLPVPRNRTDDGYFAPLAKLRQTDVEKIFLGLVHLTDGVDGARRRMATGSKYVADFGLATECGWGRRDPATIASLIQLHTAL